MVNINVHKASPLWVKFFRNFSKKSPQKVENFNFFSCMSRIRPCIGRRLGDYSLGRNWAKIEPFWARIRIQNVPKVIQKCSDRPLRPQKPHNSRITKQNRPKNGCFSLGRNWAIFGHVLVHIFGSNLPNSKIPKDLSPSYCHRAVEKKGMKIGWFSFWA